MRNKQFKKIQNYISAYAESSSTRKAIITRFQQTSTQESILAHITEEAIPILEKIIQNNVRTNGGVCNIDIIEELNSMMGYLYGSVFNTHTEYLEFCVSILTSGVMSYYSLSLRELAAQKIYTEDRGYSIATTSPWYIMLYLTELNGYHLDY